MSTQPVRTPRPSGSSSPVGRKFTIGDIASKSESLPNRYGLHAREGWGKTSLAAKTRKPIFLQVKGETGLDTLIANRQLPETPHFPELMDWAEVLAAINALIEEQHDFKTLVIDTLNSAERLCYEYVCNRDFGGDWGDRGFSGYMRGYEVSLAEWKQFLNKLDELRRSKGMAIFLLVHTKIKTFKNPDGPDYDRWVPDMHDKCWSITHKWLDAVLFGNFEVTVQTGKREEDMHKKGKALTSTSRMLYTQQRPSFDAKNRLGLPEEIYMGESADEAWTNFTTALKQGREVKQAEENSNGN